MSNLSIFKIGIGPSSSHTIGPMLAGNEFCKLIEKDISRVARVQTTLFGSLSLTGKGHLTDKAVIWGLNNLIAKDITREIQHHTLDNAMNQGNINLCGIKNIPFTYEKDIIFSNDFLPIHENALRFEAFDTANMLIAQETYYSLGGGFIVTEDEMYKKNMQTTNTFPIQFNSAKELLILCETQNKNLAQISYQYELQFHTKEHIRDYCYEIWQVMQEAYHNGCHPHDLNLPGKLHLHRRAKGLYERLHPTTDPFGILDFISLYAIAVAEENAAGGKVVTAPTNGACAVIPAVMLYLKHHTIGFNDEMAIDFLLTAMCIGALYKKNASISGAEAGCQAEIGAASSMAAAALATCLGANANVACNAAEIAMEHHLGLTCDPVGGLVQIPCIERNAFGAIKAISAVRLAMARKSIPVVTLDEVIVTMYQTGKDMNRKYKETALGGLAKTLANIC